MLAHLRHFKVIPLLKMKTLEIDDALHVAEALIEGGLPALEIIFRRHTDSKAIREIATRFPDFHIGAGNILNRDQLLRAIESQARFAIAPGVCVDTIAEANKRNITFMPGAVTASDILTILKNGLVDFHYYPAESSGGIEHLKAILEPFEHLPVDVFARGGITPEMLRQYFKVPQVAAISADWIVKPGFVEEKKWSHIKEEARNAATLLRTLHIEQ